MQTGFENAPSFKLTPKLHGNVQAGRARATGTAGSILLYVTVLLCSGRCLGDALFAGPISRTSLDWPFQGHSLQVCQMLCNSALQPANRPTQGGR